MLPLAKCCLAVPDAGHQQVQALLAQYKHFNYLPETFAATVQGNNFGLIASFEY